MGEAGTCLCGQTEEGGVHFPKCPVWMSHEPDRDPRFVGQICELCHVRTHGLRDVGFGALCGVCDYWVDKSCHAEHSRRGGV